MSTSGSVFNPARSVAEASARMFSLTASQDPGTRGPHRSLHALASSLGIEVDSNAVNAVLGAQIAEALDTPWREFSDYVQYQVTLTGMNTLLRTAADRLERLSHSRSVTSTRTLEQILVTFPGFRPARDKQEAVDRMSDLARVPRDRLGPGGKEHIETFEHLARRFAPRLLETRQTKHSLAESLCAELGVPWSPRAVSTQGTVTKLGLNMILAGTERRAGLTSAGWSTPDDEGSALVRALVDGLPTRWDGKESIAWMRENGSTKWFGSEWAGWFFEEQVRAILNESYPTPPVGGPRVSYGSTDFDYASPTRVWDAKAHTAWRRDHLADRLTKEASTFWLNDARAMRECIDEQGLGFLIIDGIASLDLDGSFHAWTTAYGAEHGKKPSGYVASTGRSRPRKVDWTPVELRAIWIADLYQLDQGIAAGWLRRDRQPDWGAGEKKRTRNDKYKGNPGRADRWTVASYRWLSDLA